MIPTPDMLGLYYPSKDLQTPEADSPDRHVGNGSTMLSIVTTSLTEETDFWNGAVGFFCSQSTAALRGIPFHVRKWTLNNKTLQITSPLPVAPVAGDAFKLFVGGKTASTQEVLSMKVSGKQPEVDTVTGPNITGITIKKASAMLGEGALEVRYEYSGRILKIRMGSADYIKHGRPISSHREIFLRHGPHTAGDPAIGDDLAFEIKKIWIKSGLSEKYSGTHIFRHTTAATMRSQGIPLKVIADVLGHDSIETTALYAQLDIPALRKVSQPWPKKRGAT